jgi:hypothetical protein
MKRYLTAYLFPITVVSLCSDIASRYFNSLVLVLLLIARQCIKHIKCMKQRKAIRGKKLNKSLMESRSSIVARLLSDGQVKSNI